jgi:ankyrin repeat protein
MPLKLVVLLDDSEVVYNKLEPYARKLNGSGEMQFYVKSKNGGKTGKLTKQDILDDDIIKTLSNKDTVFIENSHGVIKDDEKRGKYFSSVGLGVDQLELIDVLYEIIGDKIQYGIMDCFGGFNVKNGLINSDKVRLCFARASAAHWVPTIPSVIAIKKIMDLLNEGITIEEILSSLILNDPETYHLFINGKNYKFSPPHKFTLEEIEKLLKASDLKEKDDEKKNIIKKLENSKKKDFSVEGMLKLAPEFSTYNDDFEKHLQEKMSSQGVDRYLEKRFSDIKGVLPEPKSKQEYKELKSDLRVFAQYILGSRRKKNGVRTVMAILKKNPQLINKEYDSGYKVFSYVLKDLLKFQDQNFVIDVINLVDKSFFDFDARIKIEGEEEYYTPLTFVASKGYQKVFDALLEKGADYKKPDEKGNFVWDLAIKNNHPQIIESLVKFIIKNQIKIDKEVGIKLILYSFKSNNIKCVIDLLMKLEINILNVIPGFIFPYEDSTTPPLSSEQGYLQLLYKSAAKIKQRIDENTGKLDIVEISEIIKILKTYPQEKRIFDYINKEPLLDICFKLCKKNEDSLKILVANLDHFNLVNQNPEVQQKLVMKMTQKAEKYPSARYIAAKMICEMEEEFKFPAVSPKNLKRKAAIDGIEWEMEKIKTRLTEKDFLRDVKKEDDFALKRENQMGKPNSSTEIKDKKIGKVSDNNSQGRGGT